MKTRLIFHIGLLLLSLTGHAQQTLTKLDSIFMNLNSEDISTGILYDKTYRLGKADTFNLINDTTINIRNFKQILLDMKAGAVVSTHYIPTLDTLRKMANAEAVKNLIPITLLNYKYNIIKEYAIDSNLIYLSNEMLYDEEFRSQNPYYEKQVFMALPALSAEIDSSVTFFISDNFIFTNVDDTITNIEIDFDDGYGYRSLDIGDTINIIYPGYQEKLIKIKVFYGLTYGYSESHFKIAKWEDDVFDIRADLASGKGKYTISYGYDNEGNPHDCIKKPFLLVEGIDFGYKELPTGCKNGKCGSLGWVDISTGIDHVTYPEDGEPSLKPYGNGEFDYTPTFFGILMNNPSYESEPDADLIAEGYDVIYLDFYDGAADMVENSNVVIEMINWINENKCENADETIIVGASMGGQLCRYALSSMEQNNIPHCSKLYVSFDSPNQGANIALGMQELINNFSSKSVFAEDAYNRKLKRTAATQLIIYHTDGNVTTGRHGNRTLWLDNLEGVGNYPQNLRKIAIANGNKIAEEQEFSPSDLLVTIDGTSIIYLGDVEFGASAFALPGISDNVIYGVDYTFYLAFLVPIWWTEEYFAPDEPFNFDNAPGSLRADLQEFSPAAVDWGWFPVVTITDQDHYYDNYCFVPTISAFDLSINLFDNVETYLIANPDAGPFDDYYAPNTSEFHVTINEGNSHWLFEQLQLVDYKLEDVLPSIALGSTFNFGNEYRNTIHSLDIEDGGLLQINGNYDTDYGEGISAVTASTFTVYTTECKEPVININDGGMMEIGDDNTPTNNKGILELRDGSKLIVKNGGTLKLNKYSKIYIRDGATLEIRNGSTVTIEDYAEIIVTDGGKVIFKGEELNLVGTNSKLDIQSGGIIQTNTDVDFTFFGNGFVNYNEGGIFDLGTGSKFKLDGSGITDHILSIQEDAVLLIEDNDVELTDGKIYFYTDAEFTSIGNTTTADHIEFYDLSGYATHGLKCWETILADFDYCKFTGFDYGLILLDIVITDLECPAEATIDNCIFIDQRDKSIDALNVSRIDGYNNSITAKSSSIPYGIFAENITDFKWRGSMVKDYTNGTGIYLEDVTKFTLMAGNVKSNNKGIEAYHSNIWIQNKAIISLNNYGIYMDGADQGVTDADELTLLVIGDQGCGWIINNTTAGVRAWDIAVDIDAVEHRNATAEEDLLSNRFNGNGIAFDVCVDDNNTDIADDITLYYGSGVLAKGNYWKTSGAPTEGTDYEFNFKGGYGHSCDVAISPVITTDYLTSAPSGCNCELAFPCETDEDDAENIEARLASTSCDETIPIVANSQTQIMIAEQFRQAYMLFTEGDYNYSYQKFNYLKNQIEYTYPQGLSDPTCRRMYFSALYLKELCALVAEVYCQYPFWIEPRISDLLESNFVIYPNPANSIITISSLNQTIADYKIYTIDGERIAEGSVPENSIINVQGFAKNIYMVVFFDQNLNIIETKKIILQ